MKTVTIEVSGIETAKKRMKAAFRGTPQGSFISFVSFELLWKMLTPKRMALVYALTGAGPVFIREAARRVKRDVRAVHSDVTALLNAGILRRTGGGIEFPYEAVHVDFMLRAA